MDVQLLILAPPRSVARRKAFLKSARSTQVVAKISVLELLTDPIEEAEVKLGYTAGWP